MQTNLYEELAHYWHRLTPPEDYRGEVAAIASGIYDHLPFDEDKRYRLLELGAGGGHSIFHLKHLFDCTALDIAQPMLDASLEINPDVKHVRGDMRDANLGELFDVVIGHDAIDYMTSQADARAAVRTAAKHLRAGGLALIAPTYTTETFVDGASASDAHEKNSNDILSFTSTIKYAENTKSQFYLEMLFDHALDGRVIRAKDKHLCGLFSRDFWERAMVDAGFKLLQSAQLIETEEVQMFVGQKI